jgi:hypothetical protein
MLSSSATLLPMRNDTTQRHAMRRVMGDPRRHPYGPLRYVHDARSWWRRRCTRSALSVVGRRERLVRLEWAHTMVTQPACVVEVTEIVPPENVPIVAARVAERLAMPVERVQKLIDARIGPITRPLRADKAEAIAQTFEAAGVVVAIRPATFEDELDAPPPPSGSVAAERAAASAVPEAASEPEPAYVPEPEPAYEPEPSFEHEPEPESAPEDGSVDEPDTDSEPAPAPLFAAPSGSASTDVPDRGPPPEPHRDPERDDDRDPERDPDRHDDGVDLPGEPEPEPVELPGRAPDAASTHPASASPTPANASTMVSRPRAMLRIEPEDDDDDGPDDDGLEARGEIAPRRRPLVVELGETDDEVLPARDDEGDDGFTDAASWGGQEDDRTGGWSVPRRGVSSDEHHSDLAPDEGDHDGDDDAFDDDDLADDEVAAPSSAAPAAPAPFTAHAATVPMRDRPVIAVHETLDDLHDDVLDRGPLPRDAARPAGASSRAEPTPVERGVPVAWRGLGGASVGPARPVDASIPRRVDPAEAAAELEARRVVQRRTLMLWALVLAVVLFVVAQFWAAGRAATSFDHGLLRYRDGQFTAARQVWSGLAAGGDAHAQFMLGYMSETGLGQSWSARAAASWYRLAAEQGHVEAQWRLGTLYDRGLGVPWSPADARRWWAFAADGGHAEASFALGRSLFTVPRTAADLQAARVAFDRALALGWHEAATYAAVLSVVSGATNVDGLR